MSEPVTPRYGSVTPSVTSESDVLESEVTGVTYIREINIIRERQVADLIRAYIQAYVHIPEKPLTAVTLWVLSTHFESKWDVTGYLHILSPEKQTGKSTLLDVIASIVARPLPTSHISAAGLRRVLDEQPPPTLLFDEVDQVFKRKGEDTAELQSVLNNGYVRGGQALINVREGRDWKVKAFNVYGPKVLAGIGVLPDTTESRCIPIVMERMARSERKEKFRIRKAKARADTIRSLIAELKIPDVFPEPELPDELSGRQQDIWEPLIAIADWLGEDWGKDAREAALELHNLHEDDAPNITLLRDIRDIFNTTEAKGLYSVDLVRELLDMEEREYKRIVDGRPLDANRLARMLAPFGIKPVAIRLYLVDSKQGRGYWRLMFEGVWDRYL